MNASGQKNNYSSAGESALNVFAIVGFISLLIAGLWASITFIEFAVSSLSGSSRVSFSPFAWLVSKNISLSSSQTSVTSNNPVTLSWSLPTAAINPTISYPCSEGTLVKVSLSEDSSYAIPCNAPFSLPESVNSIAITPVVHSEEKTLPIRLTAETASGTISDSLSITVSAGNTTPIASTAKDIESNQSVTQTPTKMSSTETTQTANNDMPTATVGAQQTITVAQKQTQKKHRDLSIRIISIGKMTTEGQYVVTQAFSSGDVGSITFEVSNIGSETIPAWNFSAVLPTQDAYVYMSPSQKSLPAGAKATLTMSFDQIAAGVKVVSITADPKNSVRESNERNNIATVSISTR